jgi:ribosomal protein L11 methyltransferase
MPYLELSFPLEPLGPDAAESACFDCGALSVSFGDELESAEGRAVADHAPAPGAVFEPAPGEVRLWSRTRVRALFDAEAASPALLLRLARTLELDPSWLRARAVADRVWEREWLQDFHALRFGRRLWISPRHEADTLAQSQGAGSAAVIVRLDPGLAFGTGTHPSTALCLQWLDEQPLGGRTLIDFGCGSGILAIAALKLGARRAYAFDIDPQALLATQANAADNAVAEWLEICEHEAQLPPTCELLVANILSDVLVRLAASIAGRVAPSGLLLLAGILPHQAAEVAACYSPWFDMRLYALQEDWAALCGQRR